MCISIFVNSLLIYSHVFSGVTVENILWNFIHTAIMTTLPGCATESEPQHTSLLTFSATRAQLCVSQLKSRSVTVQYDMNEVNTAVDLLNTFRTHRGNWLSTASKCSFHLYKKVSICKLCFLTIIPLWLNKLDPECQKHFHRGFFQDSNEAKSITMDAHKRKKNKLWVLLGTPTC